MATDANLKDGFTLWGASQSYYAGKARSYLIKKGLPYRELYPSNPQYQAKVLPMVKAFVVPVLETPEGQIIQDSADIIEYLEARFPEPAVTPTSPVLRTLAIVLDAFGSEQMLPLAMNYRWTYLPQQKGFLEAEFGRVLHASPNREERLEVGRQMMAYFDGFLPGLGVCAETIPAIEASYTDLLDVLDAHFLTAPYLLGGRPSIADFGLMGPLYAHLARDPVPATIMKNRAPNVYRWTERMNLAGFTDGEFADYPDTYFNDDAIPETLEAVLRLVFRDFTPGLLAEADCFNTWIAAQPAAPAGSLVSAQGERKIHPSIGPIEYAWRGITMRRDSAPHGLWQFNRAANLAHGLDGAPRDCLNALLARTGGAEAMGIKLSRAMKRDDCALVLA